VGSCEQDNESLDSVTGGEVLDQMSDSKRSLPHVVFYLTVAYEQKICFIYRYAVSLPYLFS
jgi:hypothetical protein